VSDAHRVVITGLGAVTPLGNAVSIYWHKLKAGASGLGTITQVQGREELNQKIAGEVKDFDPLKYFQERDLSTLDRFSQFAMVAAREAIAQAGLVFAFHNLP